MGDQPTNNMKTTDIAEIIKIGRLVAEIDDYVCFELPAHNGYSMVAGYITKNEPYLVKVLKSDHDAYLSHN